MGGRRCSRRSLSAISPKRAVSNRRRRVGMSRERAYRLRRKSGAEGFAAAWDFVLEGPGAADRTDGRKPKVTLEQLFQRIRVGRYRPMMRAGRYVGTLQRPDVSALLAALSRLDRVAPPENYWDNLPVEHAYKKGASL